VVLEILEGTNGASGLDAYFFISSPSRICSSFIYRTQDKPRFHLGHGMVLAFLSVAFVASGLAVYIYDRLNKAKEEQCAREHITVELGGDKFAMAGCDSPLFRYLSLVFHLTPKGLLTL
jgi:hypothetical protein